MDFLCDVDSLPVGQTSVHWRSCGWSQRRVECIDVKAQVDRSLFSVPEGEKVHFNSDMVNHLVLSNKQNKKCFLVNVKYIKA